MAKGINLRKGWTREQLLVAFNLYCRLPFGKMHSRNPEIVRLAKAIGRSPSALAMKLTNIASLDPAITSTGRSGLSGASTSDKEMWREMNADWYAFAREAGVTTAKVLEAGRQGNRAPVLEEPSDADYSGEERVISSKARVGQDFFRRAVLSAYDSECCITGLGVEELLVASHIKPWRVDAKNRLNPRNGLCLAVLHDRAFDVGIITVTSDMTVRVSRRYARDAGEFFTSSLLEFDGRPIRRPGKFQPNPDFLEYHRKHIFESRI